MKEEREATTVRLENPPWDGRTWGRSTVTLVPEGGNVTCTSEACVQAGSPGEGGAPLALAASAVNSDGKGPQMFLHRWEPGPGPAGVENTSFLPEPWGRG